MFRRRRRSERLEFLGGSLVIPTVVAVNATATISLVSAATLEEFTAPKMVRLHVSLFISPATAPAAATGYGVFVGITRRVVVGGGFATPDPEVSPEHPWIYWNVFFPQIGGTAAADSNASRWIGYFRADIPMRTHIRFRENEELVLIVKNSNSSGASIQFSEAHRMLLAAGRK